MRRPTPRHPTDPRFRPRVPSGTAWWIALTCMVGGCRGADLDFDCGPQGEAFERAVEGDERPPGDLADPGGPFSVTLEWSQEGLNRLLGPDLEGQVPFVGTVPFGILPEGPGEASFSPRSRPEIRIVPVPACPACVVVQLDFGVSLASQGDALSDGSGTAQLAVPLRLRVDEAEGTTTLVADYPAMRVHEWSMVVFGFNSEEHDSLTGAVKRLLEEEIRATSEPVPLLTLRPWNLGSGAAELVATDVLAAPDQGKLVLGMATNLPGGRGRLDGGTPLPSDVPLRVSFAPELLTAVGQQMIAEEAISRRFDGEGRPDPEGPFGVTLTSIEGLEGSRRLRTEFRLWRIDEGYCGKAAIEMPIDLAPNERQTRLVATPGPAALLVGHPDNQGSGVAAEEDRALIDDHRELIDVFRGQLAEQVGAALDYDGIGIEGRRIVFAWRDLQISPTEVASWVDFDVYEAP